MEGQIREQAEKVLQEALTIRSTLLAASDWVSLGESNNVHGYQKEQGDDVFVKGIITLNFPPQEVADFIWNPANREKFESDMGFFNILHDFGTYRVEHILKKLPWPVDNRDMVSIAKRENVGEDVHIYSRSIEVDVPLAEKTVRAFGLLNSYYLKNIEDIATEIIYIGGANPRGSIPHLVINQLAGQQAFHLSKIRESLS
jgi:hypothetical protein